MSVKHCRAGNGLSSLVHKRLLEMQDRKSAAEVATQMGFSSPKILTMIASGQAKLPLDRVPAAANALDVDKALLMRLAFEQNGLGSILDAVEEVSGPVLTENERLLIELWRRAAKGRDPAPCRATIEEMQEGRRQ